MLLDPIFDRFVADSPLSVMTRSTIEYALSAQAVDEMFERTAAKQYTRELLFSSVVDLMSLVVCGTYPHVQAAFQAHLERIPVTLKCVYEKLQRIETEVSAELVRLTAQRCGPLIRQLRGGRAARLPGYRVLLADGNHLSASEHRLQEARGCSAGPLPGQSLVLLDPELGLAVDVLPCEDGHAQERSLLPGLLPRLGPGDLLVGDRNLCTVGLMAGVRQRQAFFLVRRHAKVTVEPAGPCGAEVEAETGWVSEQPVRVLRDGQTVLTARLVRVRLKQPTRDGSGCVELLSNVPAEDATAVKLSTLYLGRRSVEDLFQELAVALGCEVNTLAYPKAALFAFCVALVAYNVLAVVKAALRGAHGEAKVEQDISGYYLALEMAAVYAGMMIAIPALHWECFREASVPEMAQLLRALAGKMNLARYQKHPRKPTKNPTKKVRSKHTHVSTARILEERRKKKAKKV